MSVISSSPVTRFQSCQVTWCQSFILDIRPTHAERNVKVPSVSTIEVDNFKYHVLQYQPPQGGVFKMCLNNIRLICGVTVYNIIADDTNLLITLG